MWARNTEFMLGLWMIISPWVFRSEVRADTLICGFLLLLFSVLSYVRACRRMHLLNIGIGLWLIVSVYLSGDAYLQPILQNHVFVGWTLLIFAVIPNAASQPPPGWRRFAPAEARRRIGER